MQRERKKNIEAGLQEQELGRSKGGLSTKVYAACEQRGRPLRFLITPGQRSGILKAQDLLQGFSPKVPIADKAYDAKEILDITTDRHIEIVIPLCAIGKSCNRITPIGTKKKSN